MKKLSILFFMAFISTLSAQRGFDDVEITSERLTDNCYALFGAGGNIGLAVGDDAAYLIDD